MSNIIEPSDRFKDYFNPKKKFTSVTEAQNFFKQNWTDEKFKEMLKQEEMPVNTVDPKSNHNVLMLALKRVPADTFEKRLMIRVLALKIAVATQNCIRGVTFFPEQITEFIAKVVDKNPQEVRELEVRAVDMVKNALAKQNIGSGNDMINEDFNFEEN